MEKLKISVEQAAPIMGISPNEIRYGMRMNKFNPPIGRARLANQNTGRRKKYRYDVYRNMVMEYIGLKEWPEGRTG